MSSVLLGDADAQEYGALVCRELGGVQAVLSPGLEGDSPGKQFKLLVNEDSLLLVGEPGRVLLGLGDGHRGGAAAALLGQMAESCQRVPRQLGELADLLDFPAGHCQAGSGTTLVLAVLECDSGQVWGISYGDSSVAHFHSAGCSVRNELNQNYLHGGSKIPLALASPFGFEVGPGEGLLIFSDGVNECCYGQPARSVQLRHLWDLFGQSQGDAAAWVRSVAELALAGVSGNPGGQDNVAVLGWIRPGSSECEKRGTPALLEGIRAYDPFRAPPAAGSRRSSWLWLCLVLLLVLSNSLLYFRYQERRSRLVMEVNGQHVRRDELDTSLARYRQQALNDLTLQVLVEQAAAKAGIVLKAPARGEAEMDPELLGSVLAKQRTDALLRVLVLARHSEAERQEIYRDFRTALARYRLSFILLEPGADVREVASRLRAKASFQSLAGEFGRKNPPELSEEIRGRAPARRLFEVLGRGATERIESMAVGQVSELLPSALGWLIVRLDAREDSYAQELDDINDLLVQASQNEYLQELGRQASVTTPLTWEAGPKKISNIYGDRPERLALMKPTAAGQMASLPKPVVRATTAPASVAPAGPLRVTAVERRIYPDRFKGQPVLRLALGAKAGPGDPIAVMLGMDGWQPMTEISRSLDHATVEAEVGWWTDGQPGNGKIEQTELEFKTLAPLAQGIYVLGAEIVRDAQGGLTLKEKRADFGGGAVNEFTLKQFVGDEKHWEVRRN